MRALPVCLALGLGLSLSLTAPAWAQATKTTTPRTTTKRAPAKINLNTATVEQLEELPGIGPVRAADIVKARPFKNVTELKALKGISDEVYAELVPRVTVTETPTRRVMTKSSATTKDATTPLTSKVDLNTATVEQLEELPGIGPVRAGEIIKARPFKSITELKALKGFTAPVYAELAPHVTVAQVTTTTTTTKESMPKTATTTTEERTPLSTKVDLNTASIDELKELPGIGPVRAGEIIKARPFKSITELKALKGFTAPVYAELAPHVTVAQVTTTTTTTKESMPKTATKTATKTTTTKKATTSAASEKEAKTEDDPQHLSKKKAALASGRTININTATADELQELPGIGPVRAAAILKDRPFDTIEDIMKVDGIKDGIFGHIKEHISVK